MICPLDRAYDPTTGTLLTRVPLDGINGTTTVAKSHHDAAAGISAIFADAVYADESCDEPDH